MPNAENDIMVRRYFLEGVNEGNAETFDVLIGDDACQHGPFPGLGAGPAGPKAAVERLRRAFPDLHVMIEDVFSDEDKAAVRWAARGTHSGELSGFAPTGRHVIFTGISIFKIAQGKIREIWMELDMLGILLQAGAIPSRGAVAAESGVR
jgi:predicted ester cyclase